MPSKYSRRIWRSNSFYHVFNRGAHKSIVFPNPADYWVFRRILRKCRRLSEKGISICAYALLPTHFHLLLFQAEQQAIEQFMHRVATHYGLYLRQTYDHSGRVFQGPYQSIYEPTKRDVSRTKRYILENPLESNLENWEHVGEKP